MIGIYYILNLWRWNIGHLRAAAKNWQFSEEGPSSEESEEFYLTVDFKCVANMTFLVSPYDENTYINEIDHRDMTFHSFCASRWACLFFMIPA